MSLAFNTDLVHGAERLDYWREMVCRYHVAVAPQFNEPESFIGHMKLDDWGPVQLSDMSFSSISYVHGTQEIRNSDREDFLCVLSLESAGTFVRNTDVLHYDRGDLLFYDTNQVYSIQFPHKARTIVARIPRPLVLSRIPEADRQFAVRLQGARPVTKLAASLLENAATLSSLPSDNQCRDVSGSLLDILCTAVKDAMGEQPIPTPGQAALLKRVKRELLEQLGDCSLDIETIARSQGISPRTLNRMFASEGTTVMKWLWKQRLAASYRALSDGTVRQVTEAAFRYGFKDSSHYTRAFKKEYNLQPNKLVTR